MQYQVLLSPVNKSRGQIYFLGLGIGLIELRYRIAKHWPTIPFVVCFEDRFLKLPIFSNTQVDFDEHIQSKLQSKIRRISY
jgi:hypothetical protein